MLQGSDKMEFKRLNNMTGKDPVLNRRIASIFLNEFDAFIKLLKNLPQEPNADNIRFSLHKLRPSFVIFEMDKLIKSFENLSDRKGNDDALFDDDKELTSTIIESEHQMNGVKTFLEQL